MFSKGCPRAFFASGRRENNGNGMRMLLSLLGSNIVYLGKMMSG